LQQQDMLELDQTCQYCSRHSYVRRVCSEDVCYVQKRAT
jgi:hypothetical protein